METLEQTCRRLEHWETPAWAAKAILRKEILTEHVIDPCAGAGVLVNAALDAGYDAWAADIHDWGFNLDCKCDFLNPDERLEKRIAQQTVFFNPPFSLSEKFVDKAFSMGARKIVCFQKFSWYEGSFDTGKKRGQWWDKRRPARIWVCGDRADCWRHDIPLDKRDSSTPTAYAWFVWERGHMPAGICGHIYKGDAA